MYIDRIDLTLPEADVTAVLAAFASAESILEFLPSVSTPERKRYAKLGLKNEGLAQQIIEVGRANPELIPRGINFEKIDRDLLAREQLRTLKILLERLLGRVNDSMLLTGVDIYAAALSIYHCLRRNADTASLNEVVDELRKGFARPSRKKKEQQMEAAPAPVPEPVNRVPQKEAHVPVSASAQPVPSAPVTPGSQAPRPSLSPKPPHSQAQAVLFFSPHELPQSFASWSIPSRRSAQPESVLHVPRELVISASA